MSASDSFEVAPDNALHRVAAGAALLLGLFLLAGAYGHFAAVWPALDSAANASPGKRFALALPGLVLSLTGMVNLAACAALWLGRRWAVTFALACNLLATGYLGWLLARGVPEHPIGLFLALVTSHVIVLSAIRLGLVWPAPADSRRQP